MTHTHASRNITSTTCQLTWVPSLRKSWLHPWESCRCQGVEENGRIHSMETRVIEQACEARAKEEGMEEQERSELQQSWKTGKKTQ